MNALPWLVVPAAYLLGGISPGYWLVRLRTGGDVRTQGSGATGATNAARMLGRGGFALVLLLDAIKGAVAALAARYLGLDGGWEFAAAIAVVAGHVWPIQLGFRGGRGLGPLLGAWLVLAPIAIGACLVIAGIAWAVSKRRIPSGLFGAALLPVTTWWQTHSTPATCLAAVAFGIVAFAHRSHFQTSAAAPIHPAPSAEFSRSSHESRSP
jgi:glycerol-3-phosphate acyltransferase PlsY